LIDQLLGHYRILSEIGKGGMGVVYRARDEQLNRDVAIKVLPPGTLADAAARKRFRQEALALAKLNHPNIEIIFEFNTQDEIDFLAMELVPGESLHDKLKSGPLPESDVTRLAIQLADGLTAAHESGVIHRDLKPANLFLTPDGRLKILDFGLAKLIHPDEPVDVTRSVSTDSAAISGTVPYMSPEQLRSQPADQRSDIYAAGAVLYEISTGRRPFPQTNGAELMGAILHGAPVPPRSLNARISPGFASIISKSLARDPAERYASAHELRRAIEELLSARLSASGSSWLVAPAKKSRLAFAVGIILAAVLVLGLTIGLNFQGLRDRLFSRNSSPSSSAQPGGAPSGSGSSTVPGSPIVARRSVAVLGFKNVSGQTDKAWLSTALSEMLTTELGAGGQLRTVPGESVAQMKVNLSLSDADSYGRETLSRIRQSISADDVVVGSFIPLGGNQIRVDLRLQDAGAGETLALVSEKGSEDQIDDLVSRAGASLREKLGAGEVQLADVAYVKAVLPSNSEAAKLYSEGLVKLRARSDIEARDLFQKSVALDPKFALAHSALAAAWNNLGYETKAEAEAKTAFDLSGDLGREDKLAVEARYREAAHNWDAAIGVYRTLVDFFPDNLEYGLHLAIAQRRGGHANDAIQTVQQLKRLPAPASNDPRIDLEESADFSELAKWKESIDAADRAITKGRASGARTVVAQALGEEGAAYRYLGQFEKAKAAYSDSVRIYSEIGDRWGAASSRIGLGATLHLHGEFSQARDLYEQSLAVFKDVGAKRSMANTMNSIAMSYYDQGDLPSARKMYQQALDTNVQIEDKYSSANILNSMGNLLAEEGDQEGAKQKYQRALAIFREGGAEFDAAMTMSNIGELELDMGELDAAQDMFQQALVIKRKAQNRHSEAYTLSALGTLFEYRGDLAAAKKNIGDALAIRTTLGEVGGTTSEDKLALAAIALEEGQTTDALAGAQKAAAEYQGHNEFSKEGLADSFVARASLAQGKLPDAQSEIQQAEKLVAKSEDPTISLPVNIAAARIAAASGDCASARKILDAALASATKVNLVIYQFEARLALGELDLQSGQSASGHDRLSQLEKDASAKGYLLIARKAHAADH
jgi:serine/threonine protein kinase/tetratricopeptide (TPR) repeat protein